MPSEAAIRALRAAMVRPRGTICPIAGVHAAAETALLKSLVRNGYAEMRNAGIPFITDHGVAAALRDIDGEEGKRKREENDRAL